MPAPGQVFDLLPKADVGPWSNRDRKHPGVVVSESVSGRDPAYVVVPCTGTRPRLARPTHLELTERHGTLDPPLWVLCEYPTTVPHSLFQGLGPRATLPKEVMAVVRTKLAFALRLSSKDQGT